MFMWPLGSYRHPAVQVLALEPARIEQLLEVHTKALPRASISPKSRNMPQTINGGSKYGLGCIS